MKKLLIIIFLFAGYFAGAQTVGQFRYDTTKFIKAGGRNHVMIDNLIQTSDSANKPLVVGADGVIKRNSFWPGGGGSGVTVTSYGKNATGDSTILTLSNGTRYAAKDSLGSGSAYIPDTIKVKLPCYVKTAAESGSAYDSLICPIDSLFTVYTSTVLNPGLALKQNLVTLTTVATATGAATFNQSTGALVIPAPTAETQTAASTAVTFTTVTIPNTYGAYTVYRNGVRNDPVTDYTVSGNIVTGAAFIVGDTITVEIK